MSTERTIRITFDNARAQAQQLENCANELRGAGRQLETVMSDLRQAWSGDAATQYLVKCSAMRDRFLNSAKNLDSIAAAIRKAAQAYYDAEMRALEIIAAKEGGGG